MNSTIRSTADLARTLGLSRWTVSRALNGHPEIHPETVARVQAAAEASGFAPSVLGRGLRKGRTGLVGVCLPDLEDYFLVPKVSRLQEALVGLGHQPVLQIAGDEESEVRALRSFSTMRCEAVILIASRLPGQHPFFQRMVQDDVRLIFIDPLHLQEGFVVSTDRSQAMQQALKHIHRAGHQHVAVAGIDPRSPYGQQRDKGLRLGCRTLRWKFEQQVVYLNNADRLVDFELGQRLADDFLASHYPCIKAVIALNDRVAIGMMHRLQKAGLRLPEDVIILGYDNTPFASVVSPELTSLDPNVDELISQAVRLLDPTATPGRVSVRPHLAIRDSTRS